MIPRLEPLKNYDVKPYSYAVFDIETNAPANDKVWAVGYIDERRKYHVFSVESSDGCEPETKYSLPFPPEKIGGPIDIFLRHLFAGKGVTIYSHNGGSFDLQYVARWIVEHASELSLTAEIIPISSSIMALDVRRGRERWKFLDSYRIMPMSLDKIAKTFGLPNKKTPEGVDKDDWYANLFRNPERWDYLATDVDILQRSILAFVTEVREIGGDVAISGASTAMRTYRRGYMPFDITISRHFRDCTKPEGLGDGNCIGCQHDFFRDSYYGGRVESFYVLPFKTDTPVYYGDVNSMYPFAMLQIMPCEPYTEDSTRFEPKWERETGFVEATVYIPEDCYLPPLPYRYKSKLIFPCGTFRGTWESSELSLLKRIGGKVEQVHRAVWAEGNYIFAKYVRELYKFRDKNSKFYSEGKAAIAKILLNALYGKFGTNYLREKIWIHPTAEEILDHGMKHMLSDYAPLFLEEVVSYPDYLIPQIAARVTALARAQLWSLMYEGLEQGAKLYYCDTDSIVSSHEYKWSESLGGLKLEKSAHSGHFAAPKLYRFGDSESDEFRKQKGFGRGFTSRKDTRADWEDVVSGTEYIVSSLSKLKTWSRDNDGPHVIASEKKRKSKYDKRRVFDTGETAPWIIVNGELT